MNPQMSVVSEQAATALKIKLNINDPANYVEAEDMFILHSMHLLEQAVSIDAVERLKLRIASLDQFQANIPFGSVSFAREAFTWIFFKPIPIVTIWRLWKASQTQK